MKKFVLITLALILALSLCACGGDNGSSKDSTKPTGSSSTSRDAIGYTFTTGGNKFGVGMDAKKVVEKLGTYKDRAVTESCGDMGGNDINYFYANFTIYANDAEGYERIYCIELTSDVEATEKNVCIGATADEVKNAYGAPSSETSTGLIYKKDGMSLTFMLENGAVSSIQYYG